MYAISSPTHDGVVVVNAGGVVTAGVVVVTAGVVVTTVVVVKFGAHAEACDNTGAFCAV